jgi:hypothetical protein
VGEVRGGGRQASSEYRRLIWTSQISQNRHVLVVDASFFRRDLGFYSLSFDTGHEPDPCGVQSPYRHGPSHPLLILILRES